jgi:hypothetical protein
MNILCSSSIRNDTFMPPANQAKSRAAVIKGISPKRFAPYLAESEGHEKNALDLYWWNVRMSRDIYSALHIFEVFLRNAMDEQLRDWNERTPDRDAKDGKRSADWMLDPNDLIQRKVGDKLTTARDHAIAAIDKSSGIVRLPTHDEVLAQTSFGLWALMLPTAKDAGKRKLWDEALVLAFPGAKVQADEREIISFIKDTHALRNRIAHLEPIFRMDSEYALKKMERVLRAIDPKHSAWFAGKEIGLECWRERA